MKQRTSKVRLEDLTRIEPLTNSQGSVFEAYRKDYNLILSGSAGTGKSFTAMYLALEDVLDRETNYNRVVVVRSITPTKDIGFLPGTEEEKKTIYEAPYKGICNDLFHVSESWDKLKACGDVEFVSTSFLRGVTLDNCIVILDEMQNCSGRELNTVITRLGNNCKLIICGDYYQSDLRNRKEREDILSFLTILQQMKMFKMIEFNWEDIVRSSLCREYIMTKEMLKLKVDW